MRVAVIINPISGARGRADAARQRVGLATAMLAAARVEHEVSVTERKEHGYELARAAVARGTSLVVAWGGDGTMNEVARAVAFRDVALGLIPAGSGNGLARELHLPTSPEQAFATALRGPEHTMDVGEINGRFFFNAAGVGFDAHVAWLFNNRSHGRRGLWPYVTIAARELFAYRSPDYRVSVGGTTIRTRALLIAVANSRQYGNGALIAPTAQLSDGKLDLVIVKERPPLATLWGARRLFSGTLSRARGVTSAQVSQLTISAEHPLRFHVDGEPVSEESPTLTVRVHPRALRVRGGRGHV